MIEIDGSQGSGGGQIIRTSLSLATITGQSIRIARIRYGRPQPGLAAQHLTAVRAAAQLCLAKVKGDALGETTLEFIPSCPPQAGKYSFDVSEARVGGSAGAVSLILQTILLPLALASGESRVILKGGTHVAWSPTFNYIEQVYLPLLRRMGVEAEVTLNAIGWYPVGGGEVELLVNGRGALKGIELVERGKLQLVRVNALVTKLPSHIAQRMSNRAEKDLQQLKMEFPHLKIQIQPQRVRGIAPGAGIFITAEYEHTLAGFSALGKKGLAAEKVAQIATSQFWQFHHKQGTVDLYLGDQLLLPAALASTPSQYQVVESTPHLRSNLATISQFDIAKVLLEEDTHIVQVEPQ